MGGCFLMRAFGYEKLAETTRDKEVLNYIDLLIFAHAWCE